MITVFIDGLCEPKNPNGVACWGFCIYKEDTKICESKGVIGQGLGMSNNLAEYTALYEALQKLTELGLQNEEIIIKSDSRLLVNQMTNLWEVHDGLYYPAYIKAKNLIESFCIVSFVWIPREENSEADKLSRITYEDYCRIKGVKPEYHTNKIQVFTFKKDTCMTCKWVIFSGPHVGCYKGYKYHGWLPKSFAMRSKCPDYLPKEE